MTSTIKAFIQLNQRLLHQPLLDWAWHQSSFGRFLLFSEDPGWEEGPTEGSSRWKGGQGKSVGLNTACAERAETSHLRQDLLQFMASEIFLPHHGRSSVTENLRSWQQERE